MKLNENAAHLLRRARSAGSDRVLVGVTGPDRFGATAWMCTRHALRRAGAHPVRITPNRRLARALPDALVLGGGADIEPSRYGQPSRQAVDTDPERDTFEWQMLEAASGHGIPVLGICRGAQVLNTFFGGTLHQEISELVPPRVRQFASLTFKEIEIVSDSRLARILGATDATVNSLHHQSVDRVAAGFRVTARDTEGLVQAIEAVQHRFMIGVQWHPEYLPFSRVQHRLFEALVTAVTSDRAPNDDDRR